MTPRARAWIWATTGAVGILVAAILLYPDVVEFLTTDAPTNDAGIPPAFSGNRAAYGFALFSLFSMTSLAIRKLILLAAQLRLEPWHEDPDVGLYRLALAALMVVIILGAGPDVILLLIWGEAGARTIVTAMTFDRLCDGLTIIPFLAAVGCLVRAEQLERFPRGPIADLAAAGLDEPRARSLFIVGPRLDAVADSVRIVLLILAVAAGLALLK